MNYEDADQQAQQSAPTSRRNTVTVKVTIGTLLLISGAVLLVISFLANSSVLVFAGLGLTFWGALLYYVTPSKRIPIELLNASISPPMQNIQKMLDKSDFNSKGIYLPPKYLKNFASSCIFIPSTPKNELPKQEVDVAELYSVKPRGILLHPPGLGLLSLFEKKLGRPFATTDLAFLERELSDLLTEDLAIAQRVKIAAENGSVTVKLTNHIFTEVCEETDTLKIYDLIGCPLSSALACIIAKATGKPVMIDKQDQTKDGKTLLVRYNIMED